ncbi:MAG: hypothetical protein H6744_04935 [Deltaproteobacteria bacterium]|nr:hypothetical protein [Deltaproteobacteria bacterium]MCB9786022.1 hypothetical protein [Deltaproteobacteria bacterium]
MTRRLTALCFAASLLATSLLGACRTLVGDSCTTDSDCGSGLYCERSLPGGYCTSRSCEDRDCPDEALCVRFELDTSFCMRACNQPGDCRADYLCDEETGPSGFCAAFTE